MIVRANCQTLLTPLVTQWARVLSLARPPPLMMGLASQRQRCDARGSRLRVSSRISLLGKIFRALKVQPAHALADVLILSSFT